MDVRNENGLPFFALTITRIFRCRYSELSSFGLHLFNEIVIGSDVNGRKLPLVEAAFQEKQSNDSLPTTSVHLDYQVAFHASGEPAFEYLRLHITQVAVFLVGERPEDLSRLQCRIGRIARGQL